MPEKCIYTNGYYCTVYGATNFCVTLIINFSCAHVYRHTRPAVHTTVHICTHKQPCTYSKIKLRMEPLEESVRRRFEREKGREKRERERERERETGREIFWPLLRNRHTHTHTHTHTHPYTYVHMHIHINTHAQRHAHSCAQRSTCRHV